MQVSCDGTPLDVQVPGDGRVHQADPRPGTVIVSYEAMISGTANSTLVTDADRITYLRPSRCAESDRLAPIAQAESAIRGGADLLAAVSSWVGSQLC